MLLYTLLVSLTRLTSKCETYVIPNSTFTLGTSALMNSGNITIKVNGSEVTDQERDNTIRQSRDDMVVSTEKIIAAGEQSGLHSSYRLSLSLSLLVFSLSLSLC